MSPLNMNANPSGGAVSEMQRRVIDGRNSRERGPNSQSNSGSGLGFYGNRPQSGNKKQGLTPQNQQP